MEPNRPYYSDRNEAGRRVAQALLDFKGRRDVVVVAISPAGALVADGLAEVLELPIDIFLTRRVGIPGYEDVSMGTVSRGAYLPDQKALGSAAISLSSFVEAATIEEENVNRIEADYRGGRQASTLTGSTVIVVDEGATDAKDILTSTSALRRHGVGDIVVAIPLATKDVQEKLAERVHHVVCPQTIDPGKHFEDWYLDATEVDDESVRAALHRAAERTTGERHTDLILKHPV